MDLEKMLQILTDPRTLMGLTIILVLLLAWIIVRQMRRRSARKLLRQREETYNRIKSVPVLFKLNKVSGLGKINDDVAHQVDAVRMDYEDVQRKQEQIGQALADADDALALGKVRRTRQYLETADMLMTEADEALEALDASLDQLLEQETRQRVLITQLKDRFRSVRTLIQGNASALAYSQEALDDRTHEIEHLFSSFEEWMFANEYNKAQETSTKIETELNQLDTAQKELPDLITKAKVSLPKLIDQLSERYQKEKGKGVYLDHLEVFRNVEAISGSLKDDLVSLREAQVEGVADSLQESEKRLTQLIQDVDKEGKADTEIEALRVDTQKKLQQQDVLIRKLSSETPLIVARYNFEHFEEDVQATRTELRRLLDNFSRLSRMIEKESIPATTMLISLRETAQDVGILDQTLVTLTDKIEVANADEHRARKQVIKLYLILNDIQMRVHHHHPPVISDTYQRDMARAYAYIRSIRTLLDEEALNVKILNATVNEAIDYIYKLHNNINNLIGVVNMVESAIVYANKFRAYVPDVHTALTKAEIMFQNGEYTQALTTVIAAIDKQQPGVAHERIIREHAQREQ